MNIRHATKEDTPLILDFIKKLAEYEDMSSDVVATEEILSDWIFDKKCADVIFISDENREVGFALYFRNFSTFLGRAGLYLEDLFVLKEERGKGYGKALLKELAKIAVKEGLGRFEWACLDWNTPSIDFYLAHGAIKMDGWTTFRLTGKALTDFAEN